MDINQLYGYDFTELKESLRACNVYEEPSQVKLVIIDNYNYWPVKLKQWNRKKNYSHIERKCQQCLLRQRKSGLNNSNKERNIL